MFGLEFIKRLKPASYFYNDKISGLNNFKKHFGFLAQDINDVLDEDTYSVVNKRGSYYTVNYLELIAPMVKSIQELNLEIEKLKKEIEILKDEKNSHKQNS